MEMIRNAEPRNCRHCGRIHYSHEDLHDASSWRKIIHVSLLNPESLKLAAGLKTTISLMHRNKLHPHSITPSALSRIDGGTVRPSIFAVLRLTIIKYFTGI